MQTSRDALQELNTLLFGRLGSLLVPPGRRSQLAVACFVIALEHQRAVSLLIEANLHASAFVMLRPLFEATVKGAWLAHGASDHVLEKHARGEELPGIAELLKSLRASPLPREIGVLLAKAKDGGWKVMSSFNHAGFAQMKRWISGDGIEPQYSPAELEEAANFASVMGL